MINKDGRSKSPLNQHDKNSFKYLSSNKIEVYYSTSIVESSSYSQLNNSTTNSSTSIPSPLSDQIL
jgi:hypothetical protein